MGDQKSGNTMQTSNSSSNSTSTAGPNPYLAPMLQNITTPAYNWSMGNLNAPGYFPTGTVAAQSPWTQTANANLMSRGASGMGYQLEDTAKHAAWDTISGQYLNAADNPAYQASLEASFRPQAEQFRDIVAPGINATFAGSGRTGGGAHVDTTMRGYQDLARSQSDAAAKAALGYYQGERNNQFQAMNMLPQFQAMDYQNLAAQGQAGGQQDAYAQRLLDDQNAKYAYDTTGQLDWYNRLSQTLQGMYPGGQTTGQQSGSSSGMSQMPQQGGGVGSFLGPAMSVAGMALPFLKFSDARLKDVHARVGFTDTGFPLYLYNYKGEDSPQIGPMAQDVERVMPDAVAEHPSGYKVVDYSRLAPEGDL
jgi:hypothetical protein